MHFGVTDQKKRSVHRDKDNVKITVRMNDTPLQKVQVKNMFALKGKYDLRCE